MRTRYQGFKELDRIDRRILDILQSDGRISMTDLAERVGLSATPCTERVRRLEKAGVIQGYYARLDPKAMDLPLLVFVEIKLSTKSGEIFEAFRREVLTLPHVLEVRGKGFMIGIEFDAPVGKAIKHGCTDRRLLVTLIGSRVIRLLPPLIATQALCDDAVAILREAVTEAYRT